MLLVGRILVRSFAGVAAKKNSTSLFNSSVCGGVSTSPWRRARRVERDPLAFPPSLRYAGGLVYIRGGSPVVARGLGGHAKCDICPVEGGVTTKNKGGEKDKNKGQRERKRQWKQHI